MLNRTGLSRLKDIDPAEPVRRYERDNLGELILLDIKKLGRFHKIGHRITGDRTCQSTDRTSRKGGTGWEFVHICIDDASRIAFNQILPDERKESAVAFLNAAIAYYASLGVTVSRFMTDNGGGYKSRSFRAACKALGLKHIRTRPCTLETNGKAARFIQTARRRSTPQNSGLFSYLPAHSRQFPVKRTRCVALQVTTRDVRVAKSPPLIRRLCGKAAKCSILLARCAR